MEGSPDSKDPQQQQEMMEGEDDGGEANLEDYIEILDEHRKNGEREGKYVEAEMAKNRIEELKAQDLQKRFEELRLRHKTEAAEIEEAHLQEFNAFNQNWDKRMNEFQVHGMNLLHGTE